MSLWHGFGFWRHHTGRMLVGLVPAVLSGLIFLGLFILLLAFLTPITEGLTPFADDWPEVWKKSARLLLGTTLVISAGILSIRVFTVLALTIGGPIYEKIVRIAEENYGGITHPQETGFWRSLGGMGRVVVRSVIGTLGIGLVSLIPVVGAPTASVLGVIFTATIVAREFTLMPMQLRGLDITRRNEVLRSSLWRSLGFGLGMQLCYLVPLGAVLSMPAASAASVHLTRTMLGEPTARPETTPTETQEENLPVSD